MCPILARGRQVGLGCASTILLACSRQVRNRSCGSFAAMWLGGLRGGRVVGSRPAWCRTPGTCRRRCRPDRSCSDGTNSAHPNTTRLRFPPFPVRNGKRKRVTPGRFRWRSWPLLRRVAPASSSWLGKAHIEGAWCCPFDSRGGLSLRGVVCPGPRHVMVSSATSCCSRCDSQ